MNREYFIENEFKHNLKLYKLKNAETDCWYIYDRNIHQNKRGAESSNILLVNTKDWNTNEHPQSFLKNCIYVVNYLDSLASTKSAEKHAIELLEEYKDHHQETVAFKELEIRRNQYLKEKGYGPKKCFEVKLIEALTAGCVRIMLTITMILNVVIVDGLSVEGVQLVNKVGVND